MNLKSENFMDLNHLGSMYHDLSMFSANNKQEPGCYPYNQRSKEYIIRAYIQLAIAKSRQKIDDKVTFLEMFCADGYYTICARYFGANISYGVDLDEDSIKKAEEVVEELGINNINFFKKDVNEIDDFDTIDIVANVGGLYHVSNPKEILIKSYNLARRYLIVQSVVSLDDDSEDYYVSPAPEWTWGCRFNQKSFDSMIKSLEWDIIDSHYNELEGNHLLRDRGSVYYLIKVGDKK